jgi:hypothetical protein
MQIETILPFDISNKYRFVESLVYKSMEKAVIFEKNGHLLITSKKNVEELQAGKIPHNIEDILKSRRFIIDKNEKEKSYNVNIKPEFFMIDMTNKCNMRCEYCLRNTEYDQDSISYTKLDDIIYFIKSYCKENGIKNISVQAWGGEPLLEKDKILYMVNKLKMKNTKVHFSIETNATLLTNNNILSMYESHVGLGISIDGGMNIHNKQRKFISGKDTYDIVINNMQETKNIYNNRIGTITTITRESAKKIESVIDNIVIDLGINNIKMNFVHLSNYRNCNDICLTPKEIAETELRIFRKIIELQEMGYSVIEQNIMAKLKNILFRKYTDVCLSCGCCGGRKMIVFDMHGNIFPCELTDQPEYAIGNIYNGIPLISQIENSIKGKNSFFDKKENTECIDCYWKIFCKGGCTVRVMSNKNNKDVDITECEINKVLYPELIKLIIDKPEIVNKMLGWDGLYGV